MAELPPVPRLRVGIDRVQIGRMVESMQTFGERVLRRVLTGNEIRYA